MGRDSDDDELIELLRKGSALDARDGVDEARVARSERLRGESLRKSGKKQALLTIVLCAVLVGFLFFGGGEKDRSGSWEAVNASSDPVQEPYDPDGPIALKLKGGDMSIVPMRNYVISGRVVGKKYYDGLLSYDGTNGDIAPVDLAIAWGELAEPEYDRYITYSQGSRFYYYSFSGDCPLDQYYIRTHSANIHIIPADEAVRMLIDSVDVDQLITLEGYLVRASGEVDGRSYRWVSSLTRDDEGFGSCELLYVKKVRLGRYA